MATIPLSREVAQAALDAITKHGGAVAAERATKIPRATLQSRAARAQALNLKPTVAPADCAAPVRATRLSKRLAQAALNAVARYGNLSAAARALKMPRETLRARINRATAFGLSATVKPRGKKMPTKAAVLDAAQVTQRHRALQTPAEVKRFVITAAQNATPVHKAFLQSLLTYCKHNAAELLVIPYRYKNPTSHWSKAANSDDWWAPELAPYLFDKRMRLNPNLLLLADIKTQPTATAPLQGFESISGANSAIIGHPKLELATVPTPQAKLPKIMTTTGAVTMKNYSPTKAGKKGDFHHTYGACIVEVVGKTFHLRQLNAVRDGSFMDLNFEYAGADVRPVERLAGLDMGDTHEEFVDPGVVDATFGPGGIVPTLKPMYLVWHDVHDGYARNHHHRDNPFIEYAKHHAGMNNVEKALQKTFDFVDRHTPSWCSNVFVPSNHPDVIARWVREANPKTDPVNCVFWARTFEAMMLGTRMGESGAQTIDPFVYWAKQKMKCASRTHFLARDESFRICGIEVGYHGDQGANGARGSRKGFSRIGERTVIGHSHSPGITEGAYQVGTSSRLTLEYNRGPSSWLHTHCLIYVNGKRSLVNIIGGQWRA